MKTATDIGYQPVGESNPQASLFAKQTVARDCRLFPAKELGLRFVAYVLTYTVLHSVQSYINAIALRSSFCTNSGVGASVGLVGCERKIITLCVTEKFRTMQ